MINDLADALAQLVEHIEYTYYLVIMLGVVCWVNLALTVITLVFVISKDWSK